MSTVATLFLIHWAGMLFPGPNVLLVSGLAAAGHRRAACQAALGISTVAVIWASVGLIGVSAALAAAPKLKWALQCAGSMYLVFVGVRMLRSRRRTLGLTAINEDRGAYLQGFLTNILNAKTALFFAGVFSAAVPDDASALFLILILLMVFLNAIVWHFGIALALSFGAGRAAFGSVIQVMPILSALALIGLGTVMLFESIPFLVV